MSLPDIKTLKKLVSTCRKLGIKTFKSSEYEFTLEEHNKVVKTSKAKLQAQSVQEEMIDSDQLSLEQLLAWNENAAFAEPSEPGKA